MASSLFASADILDGKHGEEGVCPSEQLVNIGVYICTKYDKIGT